MYFNSDILLNNKRDNLNRFILFLAKYLAKQARKSIVCKIFEFITNHDEFIWVGFIVMDMYKNIMENLDI